MHPLPCLQGHLHWWSRDRARLRTLRTIPTISWPCPSSVKLALKVCRTYSKQSPTRTGQQCMHSWSNQTSDRSICPWPGVVACSRLLDHKHSNDFDFHHRPGFRQIKGRPRTAERRTKSLVRANSLRHARTQSQSDRYCHRKNCPTLALWAVSDQRSKHRRTDRSLAADLSKWSNQLRTDQSITQRDHALPAVEPLCRRFDCSSWIICVLQISAILMTFLQKETLHFLILCSEFPSNCLSWQFFTEWRSQRLG